MGGDDVTLLYNSKLWTPLNSSSTTGCTGPKDRNVEGLTRPFLIHAFESTEIGGLRVVVIAAHFPHPSGWEEARSALAKAISHQVEQSGSSKVVLIADTNFATQIGFPPDDLVPKQR